MRGCSRSFAGLPLVLSASPIQRHLLYLLVLTNCWQRDHDTERRARVRLMEAMTELEDSARETDQLLLSSQSEVASFKMQLQVRQLTVVLRSPPFTLFLYCLPAGIVCGEARHAGAPCEQRCAIKEGGARFELGAGAAARQR